MVNLSKKWGLGRKVNVILYQSYQTHTCWLIPAGNSLLLKTPEWSVFVPVPGWRGSIWLVFLILDPVQLISQSSIFIKSSRSLRTRSLLILPFSSSSVNVSITQHYAQESPQYLQQSVWLLHNMPKWLCQLMVWLMGEHIFFSLMYMIFVTVNLACIRANNEDTECNDCVRAVTGFTDKLR